MNISKEDIFNADSSGVYNGVFVREGKLNIQYKFYTRGWSRPRLILN